MTPRDPLSSLSIPGYRRLACAAAVALLWCAGITRVSAQPAAPTPAEAPATPDCPKRTITDPQVVTTTAHILTEKSLAETLLYLETLERCGVLGPISDNIDRFSADRRDIRTAILMVRTLSRGPVDMGDVHTQSAVKLIGYEVEKLDEQAQRALLEYAAHKLSGSEETEALLAFARGNVKDWVEPTILTQTQPVTRGPWNPPGGQSIPFYIGNEAHKAIAAHYVAAHKGEDVETNTTPISSMLIRLAKLGVGPAENATAQAKGALAARPDIVNLTTHEIYEIKPVGAEAATRALVAAHVATFAKAGVTMAPGRSTTPGVDGVVPAPAGHYVFYAFEPGVIVYRYQRGDYVPVPAPEKAGETSPKPLPITTAERASSPAPTRTHEDSFWEKMEEATGLSGIALGIYIVISEGSRVAFPPRNAIPVP